MVTFSAHDCEDEEQADHDEGDKNQTSQLTPSTSAWVPMAWVSWWVWACHGLPPLVIEVDRRHHSPSSGGKVGNACSR
jgi:hypothetical protein